MRKFRVLVCLLATVGLSGCWVQRGFDAGRSGWNPLEHRLSSETVDRLAVVWDTEIAPGWPVTTPVGVGERVVVTTRGGGAAGLSARTGATLWSQLVEPAGSPTSLLSPTYFDGWLYIPWNCCRADVAGWLWLRLSDGEVGDGPGSGRALFATITDVAVARGSLATMSVTLSFAGPVPSGTGVSWTHDVIAFPSDQGEPARAFAIVGDAIQWTYGTFAQSFGPECRPSTDPRFTCEPDWRTDLGASPTAPVGVGRHSVVYGDDAGTLTVLDVGTGDVRWRAELGAPVSAGPAVAHGLIFAGTSDGRLVALRAAGCAAAVCRPVWQAQLDGAPRALAAGGDVVYTTTGGTVSAFAVEGCGSPSCPALATVDAGATITGGPIVHRGRVIVGTIDGRAVAFGLGRE